MLSAAARDNPTMIRDAIISFIARSALGSPSFDDPAISARSGRPRRSPGL